MRSPVSAVRQGPFSKSARRGAPPVVSVDIKRQTPISDNVGGVKHFSSTLTHALRRARHFALVEGLAFCSANQGPLVIVSGQETRSDPSISSVTTSIMITTSNSPLQGSGTPNRYDGELLHTMGISGL